MTEHPLPADKHIHAGVSVIAVGGDSRQAVIMTRLIGEGFTVSAIGLAQAAGLLSGVRLLRTPQASLTSQASIEWERLFASAGEACVLLLPLPLTRDGVTVSCPLDPEAKIPLSDIAEAVARTGNVSVLGGCMPSALADRLRQSIGGTRVADYYASEAVQLKNARITAEGAIMTAMELTDTALLGSRAAVVGYGRIGRSLSRLLVGLGVRVTVCARRADSLAEAWGDGCDTVDISAGSGALSCLAHGYDVIFNTVPACLFDRALLERMDDRTHIIDLASPPGCVSAGCGARASRVVRALSLPGRYAPRTAGEVLAEAVLELLGGGFGAVRGGKEGGQ